MFDCLSCGACCVNSDHNRAGGYPWYVEVDDPESELLQRKDLCRRYVVEDPAGVPHMKLHADGRCTGLKGKIGRRVSCEIYRHRPQACKGVEPGDVNCMKARKERGIQTI